MLPIEILEHITHYIQDIDTLYNFISCLPKLMHKYKLLSKLVNYVKFYKNKIHNIHKSDRDLEMIGDYNEIVFFPSNNFLDIIRRNTNRITSEEIMKEAETKKDFAILFNGEILCASDPLNLPPICGLYRIGTFEEECSICEGYVTVYKEQNEMEVPIVVLEFYQYYNIVPKYIGVFGYAGESGNDCPEFQDYLALCEIDEDIVLAVNCNPASGDYLQIAFINWDMLECSSTRLLPVDIYEFMKKIPNLNMFADLFKRVMMDYLLDFKTEFDLL